MYRKLTYIKHEYDLELFRIDEFDTENRLVYNKIINQEGVLETKIKYDGLGNVILEENFVDGKMSDYTVTEFNYDNEPISISVFIQDELYEKTVITKSKNLETSISTVDGVESLKIITETNETNTILSEYEYGEFVRKVVSEDTEQGRKEIIYDENNNITFYENYEFDRDDNILRHEVFNAILEKVALEVRNHHNGNIIDITYESIEEYQYYTYEYDANNNLIDYKIKDKKDNILGFDKSVFDDQNREIETIAYSMGFQPIHYEIKYEEIN